MTPPRGAHLEREQLIESHLPLVRSVARRYAGRGESFEDLVQVGSVGLLKASNRFEESRGVAFATFAAPTIEGEIRRHLRDRSSTVRVPRELQRTSSELGRQRSVLAAALGHSPSVAELAAALETDPQEVQRALEAELARNPVPLTPDADIAVSSLDGDREESENRLSLAAGIRALDDRERAIVFLRFHADMTEKDIAAELGLSQAHVSRLLSGALAQLRSVLVEATDRPLDGGNNVGMAVSHATSSKLRKARRPSSARTRDGEGAGELGARGQEALARYMQLPYGVLVKSVRDGEQTSWSAAVEELPDCTARGATPEQAVQQLRAAMRRWLAAALAAGGEIPVPATQDSKPRTSSSYSGRFLVRMPGTLHAQLAHSAERDHLSLNRYVTGVLAASVSQAPQAGDPGEADEPQPSGEADLQADGIEPSRGLRVALAANLAVVILAAVAAIVLLVLALQAGI